MARRVLGVVAAVSLAATLVFAGLLVCMAPPTARLLSQATSLDELSPYTRDELVELAVVTRDYTLGTIDEDALFQAEATALAAAVDDGRIGAEEVALAPDGLRATQPDDLAAVFAQTSERYVLSNDALAHLDDCRAVITVAACGAVINLLVTVGLAYACARCGGRRLLGGALLAGGAFVLAVLIVLGGWALADFQGFFAVFHSLFFAAGTWMFPWDSLLICLYPDAFWTGMATVWVATSGLLSAACVVAGVILRRRSACLR